MSESQERELDMSERTVLRMHKWICSNCRTFGGQLGFLRQAMKGFADRSDEPWPDGGAGDDEGGDRPPGAV